VADAREHFVRELVPHFALEETVLLPACEAAGEPLATHARQVRHDHEAMRDLLAALDGHDPSAPLDALGRLLERHVRFEERTWFPAMEATLGAVVLGALAPRLLVIARMPERPTDVVEYKRTPEFDEHSMPNALAQSHRLKPDTWGEIVVAAGRLLYVLEDEGDLGFVLTPAIPGTVAPERPHHVTPQGPVRFLVRFLRT
jgi:tellurite resistance-related uncharacterized protein